MVEVGKIGDKTLVLDGRYISIFRERKLVWKRAYMGYYLPDGYLYWYRRRVRITERSGNTLTDYQIKIEIGAGDPIFAHARSAGEDIRFCYHPEADMLSYWIEKFDPDAEEAIIWVKVPSIPASSEIEIFMYYGNPEVASASDGSATFLFYDDFEDRDISDWIIVSGTWSAENGYLERTGTSTDFDEIYKEVSDPIANFAIDLKMLQGAIQDEFDMAVAYNADETVRYIVWNENGGEHDLQDAVDGYLDSQQNVDEANTWWDISFRKYENNFKVYKDGALFLSGSPTTDRSAETITQVRIRSRNTVSGKPTNKFDLIRVRKYTEPEPSVSVGKEE